MNCIVRIIYGTSKFEHITSFLKSLHWLPMEFRIMFKLSCLALKALNCLAPTYLANSLNCYNLPRSLHPAGKDLFIWPKIHPKKYRTRTFAYATPQSSVLYPLMFDNLPQFRHSKCGLRLTSLPWHSARLYVCL